MWLFFPSVPGLEESSSDSDLFSRLEQSVTWRGKCMPLRYWQRAWKTAPWMRLLSGLTYEPSTASHGVELWISSLRDFRVSHSAQQENAVEREILDISGRISPELLKSATQALSSLRTCVSAPSESHSETFEQWALECRRPMQSQPPSWVLLTFGVEFLPSPSAQEYGSNRGGAAGRVGPIRRSLSGLGVKSPVYREWMMGFPTGWTAIGVSAMLSFQQWQREHLLRSRE